MAEKERQLRCLELAEDLSSVFIEFEETTIKDVPEGADPDTENEIIVNTFTCTSKNRPHKDLVESLIKLRKHGLAIQGIDLADASKQIKNWCVLSLQIDGDVFKQQSRLKMVLGQKGKYTNKISKLSTSQVTMYPKDDEKVKYPDAQAMVAIVEDITEECWSYLFDGKFEKAIEPQYALFAKTVDPKIKQMAKAS